MKVSVNTSLRQSHICHHCTIPNFGYAVILPYTRYEEYMNEQLVPPKILFMHIYMDLCVLCNQISSSLQTYKLIRTVLPSPRWQFYDSYQNFFTIMFYSRFSRRREVDEKNTNSAKSVPFRAMNFTTITLRNFATRLVRFVNYKRIYINEHVTKNISNILRR